MKNEKPVSITIKESPKLDILPFDGNFSRYPFFKLQVSEARRDGSFSDVQIIRHLRDRLRGPAFESVHGALLSGCPLDRILHVLESRFGNKLQVSSDVTAKLLRFNKIRSHDVIELARFGTEVYNAVSTLQAVGFETELDNLSTLQLLTEKLPQDSQHAWGAYARRRCEDGSSLTCSMFHEFLEEHIKDRQYSAASSLQTASPRLSKISDRHDSRRAAKPSTCSAGNGTVNTASGNAEQAPEWRTTHCFFCRKTHFIARCTAFRELTIAARQDWVKKKRACVHCLSDKHQASQCHRTRPCGRNGCTENHHHLLHEDSPRPDNVGVMSAKSNAFSVLMKTVVVELKGPVGKKRCVAYLDEGSSVTLMSKRLAEELGLTETPRSLTMKTMPQVYRGMTRHR